jgi:hypothetical protein
MKLRLLAVYAGTLAFCAGSAFAQSAGGCNQHGNAVDGDAACPVAKVAHTESRKVALGVDLRLVTPVKSDVASRAQGSKPPRTIVDKSKSAQSGKAGAKKHKHKRKSSSRQSTSSRSEPRDTVTREPKRTQR